MDNSRPAILNRIRYAERLCQRTARLYRRLQTAGTFGTVLGGSAALTLLSASFGQALGAVGMVCAAVFGAALIAIRPADKAAANEADAKRYARLRSDADSMDDAQLARALAKAKESDTAEVEPLRMVAYNDVLRETGNAALVQPLSGLQRFLAALA